MSKLRSQPGKQKSFGVRSLKEAVLASFQDSSHNVAARLRGYPEDDWREVLFWLDASGLALYLLDRLRALGIEDSLPAFIRERLETNLLENRLRTAELLRQADEVATEFRQRKIVFAVMKGVTLAPDSVPEPALRSQIDLDFLVDRQDSAAAIEVLENLGYEQHATSGDTVEFRWGPPGKPDIANLYRADIQRSLELHCFPRVDDAEDRMSRIRTRSFQDGVELPSLSAPDILVQQAVHLLKHLCGEHTRVAWVLEFWRHIRVRQHHHAFWNEVKAVAATEPQANLALSIAVWLATELFGEIAHGAPEIWSADKIPNGVELWLRRYARELLLSDSLGTKLYLILRRQIPGQHESKGTARLVVPLCLPAKITQHMPGETLADRVSRYRIEARYSFQRLRFHLCEGFRYGVEALWWELRIPKAQRP
jgi:hypothetical protein